MSTAQWDGVPLSALLDRVQPSDRAWRVLVSGVDDATDPGGTSQPGASWIFSRDDLERALLAVRMNGVALPRDHGSPVRLIVPGWYGCACIKWVNRIELVPDDAPATTQMREFAARTHQPFDSLNRSVTGTARATSCRRSSTQRRCRSASRNGRAGRPRLLPLIGIVWGGSKPTNALSIRFRANLPWMRVEDCPLPASTETWSVWTHTWRPDAPGRYQIVLRVDDPTIRTRRLDLFFYARSMKSINSELKSQISQRITFKH